MFVQLELNGLARVGTSPLELLRRSVPGYLPTNDPSLRDRDRRSIRFPNSEDVIIPMAGTFRPSALRSRWRARARCCVARHRCARSAPRRTGRAAPAPLRPPVPLDRVLAVVNDEAITQCDLNEQRRVVLSQMKASNVDAAVERRARQAGARAPDHRARAAAVRQGNRHPRRRHDGRADDPAHRRGEQARRPTSSARCSSAKAFRTRTTARTSAARSSSSACASARSTASVTVSDAEVDNYLATVASQAGGEDEYLLSHIYVTRARAGDARCRRRAPPARRGGAGAGASRGTDFAQVAAAYSDAPDAPSGGNLGWRTPARLPSVFADVVRKMKPGDVSGVLRSAGGFHIVKLVEMRNRNQPDGRRADARAAHPGQGQRDDVGGRGEGEDRPAAGPPRERRQVRGSRARQLRGRVERAKGGDLGWISPGDTVPDFERAMDKLAVERDLGARAHAVRLAPDPGARAAQAGRHAGAPARAGAAGASGSARATSSSRISCASCATARTSSTRPTNARLLPRRTLARRARATRPAVRFSVQQDRDAVERSSRASRAQCEADRSLPPAALSAPDHAAGVDAFDRACRCARDRLPRRAVRAAHGDVDRRDVGIVGKPDHERCRSRRARSASPRGERSVDPAAGRRREPQRARHRRRSDPASTLQPSSSACDCVPNVHSFVPRGSPDRASRKSRAASSSGVLRHAVKLT